MSGQFALTEPDGTGLVLAPNITDNELHGGCLTTEDLDRIQSLINDFCLKSLLPHIERQMKLLNESVRLEFLIFMYSIALFSSVCVHLGFSS